MLGKTPSIWIAFALFALFELAVLTLLFLTPSEPFLTVLGPIVRRFWGERFLHYPENFILLPKLFHLAHVGILSLIGVFVSGFVIKRVEENFYEKDGLPATWVFQFVRKRYPALILGWFLSYAVLSFSLKAAIYTLPSVAWIRVLASTLLALGFQALFGFLLPAIVIEKNFLTGLWKGLTFGCEHWKQTIILVFVPTLIVIFFSLFKGWIFYFISSYPELILWVLALGILVSVFADLWVTSCITIFFLEVKNKL